MNSISVNILNLSRSLLAICLLGSLVACSSTTPSNMQPDFQVAEIAIYMHRANMNTTDFEQYKLSGGRLFQECGVIVRGRNIPAEQQLFDLSSNENGELMSLTWKLLELSQAGKAQLEGPGSSSSMFDPGFLALKVKGNGNVLQLKTSVDATAEATSEASRVVNQLTRRIRALAKPTACGNRNFYGLPPMT